jgi:hypothetical protein
MWWSFWMTNRWLLLNFDALGALSVLVTTLFSISTLSKGAGLAGLCITSAMTFTSSGMLCFTLAPVLREIDSCRGQFIGLADSGQVRLQM